jgi:hypothetical protein
MDFGASLGQATHFGKTIGCPYGLFEKNRRQHRFLERVSPVDNQKNRHMTFYDIL